MTKNIAPTNNAVGPGPSGARPSGGLTVQSEWAILDGVKTLTIDLPDPVFQWIDTTARQRQQTPEQTASEALAAAVGSAEPASAEPSCFDLMKPAWRSISGPRDLSQREGFDE